MFAGRPCAGSGVSVWVHMLFPVSALIAVIEPVFPTANTRPTSFPTATPRRAGRSGRARRTLFGAVLDCDPSGHDGGPLGGSVAEVAAASAGRLAVSDVSASAAVAVSGPGPAAMPFACRMYAARLSRASSSNVRGLLGGIVRIDSIKSRMERLLHTSTKARPASGGAYGLPDKSAPWHVAQVV